MSKLWKDRIDTLRRWAKEHKAEQGIEVTYDEIAQDLGWDHWTVAQTVQQIREHPECGIAVSVKRGSEPVVTITTPERKHQGQATRGITRCTISGYYESIGRMCRLASTQFVQVRHTAHPDSAEGKWLAMWSAPYRLALTGFLTTLSTDSSAQAREAEMLINDTLAALP